MDKTKEYIISKVNEMINFLTAEAGKRPEKKRDYLSLFYNLDDGRIVDYSLDRDYFTISEKGEDEDREFLSVDYSDIINPKIRIYACNDQNNINYNNDNNDNLNDVLSYLDNTYKKLLTMEFDKEATNTKDNLTWDARVIYNKLQYKYETDKLKIEVGENEYLPCVKAAADWLSDFYSDYIVGDKDIFKKRMMEGFTSMLSTGAEPIINFPFDGGSGLSVSFAMSLPSIFGRRMPGLNNKMPKCSMSLSLDIVVVIVPGEHAKTIYENNSMSEEFCNALK